MVRFVVAPGRVTIRDVAERGRRLGRHRVQGDQRALRRRRRDQREGPGGDPRAGLRVEPGRPQPAQPPDQRDRDPGRRPRAVQRRAAQGRGPTRSDAPATSSWSTPAAAAATEHVGLGAALPEPAERHADRRRGARHPDRRGGVLGAPVVAVDPHTGREDLPTVDSDNLQRRPARHRAPARAGPPPDRVRSPAARTSSRPGCASTAIREAMAAAGLDVDPDLVRDGEYDEEVSAEVGPRAARPRPDRPTAMFAANDNSAIATWRSRRRCGVRVPDELSVVGFDNIPGERAVAARADHDQPADPGDGPAGGRALLVQLLAATSSRTRCTSRSRPAWSSGSPAPLRPRVVTRHERRLGRRRDSVARRLPRAARSGSAG